MIPLFPPPAEIMAAKKVLIEPTGDGNIRALLQPPRTEHRRYRRNQRNPAVRNHVAGDVREHLSPATVAAQVAEVRLPLVMKRVVRSLSVESDTGVGRDLPIARNFLDVSFRFGRWFGRTNRGLARAERSGRI